MKIGPAVYRWRWFVLLGWLAAGVALHALSPSLDPTAHEPSGFLPDDNPYTRAAEALRKSFPHSSGLSQAVVVFQREPGPLTPGDFEAIERLAAAVSRPDPPRTTAADLAGIEVLSPASLPTPTNPLKSPDRKAALVIVDIPASFITVRSARTVDHIRRAIVAARLPDGLRAAVTGSSGFGHDYALAAQKSHERIGVVTLVAVLCILLLVYRSVLAALVPLAAISAAAAVAMEILAIGQHFGMHIGTGEKVFVFVLIYGAGMDYSMLFISRFREQLDAGLAKGPAAAAGLAGTFSALLASAGTDTLGLLMLCFAQYRIFRTAGAAIAVALIVALLAAVSLVPAMAGILGRALFWPSWKVGRIGGRRFWPAIAQRVTRRPGWILAGVVVLLAVPAARGTHLTWVYDTLAEVQAESPDGVGNAAVGIDRARMHWPVGQIAPVTVLVEAPKAQSDEQWQALSGKLTAAVAAVPGVQDVRSLSQPLGRDVDLATKLLLVAAASKTREEYVAADRRAIRLQAVLDQPSLTLAAMNELEGIRRAVDGVLAAAPAGQGRMTAHLAGATAQIVEVRKVTHADFHRIAVLVLAVIFLMILWLLRDWILSAFIVAVTVLSYLATLGLAYWLLTAAGAAGLDWKVEVFLFVVMVAVGVDYSIFLAARVAQEARELPVDEAVRNAVVHTGPVISSCGLIMAATLGSLMAGQLQLFVQLGLALAMGMLLDTFIIRPLLLPAFITLTRRTGRISRTLE